MHSKIDLIIHLQVTSYNVTAQSLAERLVVWDSDYHKLNMHCARVCVCLIACLLACFDRPLQIFHKDWMSMCNALSSAESESEGLLPDCSIGMKETGTGSKEDSSWLRFQHAWQRTSRSWSLCHESDGCVTVHASCKSECTVMELDWGKGRVWTTSYKLLMPIYGRNSHASSWCVSLCSHSSCSGK